MSKKYFRQSFSGGALLVVDTKAQSKGIHRSNWPAYKKRDKLVKEKMRRAVLKLGGYMLTGKGKLSYAAFPNGTSREAPYMAAVILNQSLERSVDIQMAIIGVDSGKDSLSTAKSPRLIKGLLGMSRKAGDTRCVVTSNYRLDSNSLGIDLDMKRRGTVSLTGKIQDVVQFSLPTDVKCDQSVVETALLVAKNAPNDKTTPLVKLVRKEIDAIVQNDIKTTQAEAERASAILSNLLLTGREVDQYLIQSTIRHNEFQLSPDFIAATKHRLYELDRRNGLLGVGWCKSSKEHSKYSVVLITETHVDDINEKFFLRNSLFVEGVGLVNVEFIDFAKYRFQRSKSRPLTPGLSISLGVTGACGGTLSLFVKKKSADSVYLLSCAHVLTNFGQGAVGDPVWQPSICNKGSLNDEIAKLHSVNEIQKPPLENTVDAALAGPVDAIQWKNLVALSNRKVTSLPGVISPGLAVEVVGAGTGSVAHGKVRAFLKAFRPKYQSIGTVYFVDVVLYEVHNTDGDSGALVCDAAGNPLGIHLGGNGKMGIFCKMDNLLRELGLDLI